MTFQFNADQLEQIQKAYDAAKQAASITGTKGAYASAYELVFDMITNTDENGKQTPKAGVDPASWVFLRGVPEVNRGIKADGSVSDYSNFIREYSKAQYISRFGKGVLNDEALDSKVQVASDAIAESILENILNINPSPGNENPNHFLPTVNVIAKYDAQAAATVLFDPTGNEHQISGWAGNPLFIALGYEDVYRENILESDNNAYDALTVVKSMVQAANAIGISGSAAVMYNVLTHVIPDAAGYLNTTSLIWEMSDATSDLIEQNYGISLGQLLTYNIYLGTKNSDLDILSSAGGGIFNDDLIHAGTGDDFITASQGYDIVDGGAGNDTILYATSDDVTANLTTHTAEIEIYGLNDVQRLYNIENLRTGDGNDNLTGHYGKNLLDGAAGNDKLYGGGDSDTLDGYTGNDLLIGGSGGDTYIFTKTGFGHDTIIDGSGKLVFGGVVLAGNAQAVTNENGMYTIYSGGKTYGILKIDGTQDILIMSTINDTITIKNFVNGSFNNNVNIGNIYG